MRRMALTILATLILASTAWSTIHVPKGRDVIIEVGPLVDFTDGVTPETAMTPTNITCVLTRRSDAGGNGGVAPTLVINTTLTASGGANDLVHLSTGVWSLELTDVQINTAGIYSLTLSDPDVMCPWFTTLIVDPNAVYNINTTLSETPEAGGSGRLAAAISTWGDVATPVATAASVNQTGDAYASAITAAAYAILNSGLSFRGDVTAVPGANQFTIASLIGVGTGVFSDATAPYRAFVLRDNGGAGAAPQGETQTVTAYNSATGAFTTTAFTAAVASGDTVIIMHPRIAELALIKAQTDLLSNATYGLSAIYSWLIKIFNNLP